MIKKLSKHGNSYVLLIEKPIMDLLDIKPESELKIITDGCSLIITPVNDNKRHKKFKTALNASDKRYGNLYKRLAN